MLFFPFRLKPFIKLLVNCNFFLYSFHASHLWFMSYPLQTPLKSNFSFHVCLFALSNPLNISFPPLLCFLFLWLGVWLQPGKSVNPWLLSQGLTARLGAALFNTLVESTSVLSFLMVCSVSHSWNAVCFESKLTEGENLVRIKSLCERCAPPFVFGVFGKYFTSLLALLRC